MKFKAIINSEGGTLKTLDLNQFVTLLNQSFVTACHEIDIQCVKAKQLVDAMEEAAADPEFDGLLAAGGDGTLSLAASLAWKHNKVLAVLPAGTMNLFARSLHLPLEIFAAIDAVAQGQIDEIDIATANCTPFVHQFSLGLHPQTIKQRENYKHRSKLTKFLSSFRAFFDVVAHTPVYDVSFESDGKLERRKVSSFVVTNNLLTTTIPPYADDIDGGVLGVYVAAPLSFKRLMKLAFGALIGQPANNQEMTEHPAKHLKMRINKMSSHLRFSIDGELCAPVQEVELNIHPKSLRVLVPAAV